ncbi:hypothetical protein AB0442_23210 [Kitasatospora sp. NPDC085895]|uniref:hypothetical protein n=1 Tax=Kitasatospora sp. NPDC085895 TaxID=3155057 RepID=UPI00344E4535
MTRDPVPFDRAHTTVGHWLSHPGIVMLDTGHKTMRGQRTEQQAILVGVVEKLPRSALTPQDFLVPPSVEVDVLLPDGRVERMTIPTDVVQTGHIAPRSLASERRPCPGGYQITASTSFYEGFYYPGTLGVTIDYRNRLCLLSNAHVLCVWVNQSGRDVYQPMWSQWRPWSTDNKIGRCDAAYEIFSTWTLRDDAKRNTYDFGWSFVDREDALPNTIVQVNPGGRKVELGVPEVGQTVSWVGSTTGVMQMATIASVHAALTIPLWFGYQRWENCLRLAPVDNAALKLDSGDSGAAIIDDDEDRLLGLATFSDTESASMVFGTRIPPDRPTPDNPFLGDQQLIPARPAP